MRSIAGIVASGVGAAARAGRVVVTFTVVMALTPVSVALAASGESVSSESVSGESVSGEPEWSAPLPPISSASPYQVDLPIDLTVTGSLAVVGALLRFVVAPALTPEPPCDGFCDRTDLSGLDRSVINNHDPTWATVTDVTNGVAILAPLVPLVLDALLAETDTPWADLLADTLVYSEAVLTAFVAYLGIAFAVRRPRPHHYAGGDRGNPTTSGALSFPSGHVAITVAATSAYATTFTLRHPDSPWNALVWGGAIALDVVTAWGRIAAARHFWTDVFAAVAVGLAPGVLIPWLHRKSEPDAARFAVTPMLSPDGRFSVSLNGLF